MLFDYVFDADSLLNVMWSICLISGGQATTKATVPAALVRMLSGCCT